MRAPDLLADHSSVPHAGPGFVGAIPGGLVSSQLRYLDLSGQSLVGDVPPLPSQLLYLNVSQNLLSGKLA
jgi:hypothetical protein